MLDNGPTIPAAQLAPMILRLRNYDIPRSRVAALFGITEENVSVLAHRAQPAAQRSSPRFDFGPTDLNSVLSKELSFREAEPVRTRRESKSIAEIEEDVARIVEKNRPRYRFAQAISELTALRPLLGRPRNPKRVRLLAVLHFHKGWFATHLGWTRSSIQEEQRAYALAVELYRRSGSSEFLQLVADAAMVAANSYLIRSDSTRARASLSVARQAREKIGLHPNHEYYRQLAVAELQEGKDREARQDFAMAERVMREHGEPRREAEILMASARQANLLGPINWDRAQEVLAVTGRRFASGTHEFAVNINWTAACGFSTDSPRATSQAEELVENQFPYSTAFGHQRTVATLLRLVPALPPAIRPHFVRFALYQNASRNR